MTTTATTAKQYANLHGYSQVYAYEVIREVSDKTMEIRRMKATLDPTWKPEFAVGGFAAHCSNQSEQRWLFESDEDAPIIRMRKVKPSYRNQFRTWKSAYGGHVLSDTPREFYDYNF
jgi:hypothetical protein